MSEDIIVNLGTIDWGLLSKQKVTILQASFTKQNKHAENLIGIIELLDRIQDEAVRKGLATQEEVFPEFTIEDPLRHELDKAIIITVADEIGMSLVECILRDDTYAETVLHGVSCGFSEELVKRYLDDETEMEEDE